MRRRRTWWERAWRGPRWVIDAFAATPGPLDVLRVISELSGSPWALSGDLFHVCGIAGLLSVDQQAVPKAETVRRMCDAMVHRGPDDHGLRTDGPCVLGHRRLSIIDLRPEGAQPMTNEDDTISMVVNGEIYNFIELREELEQRGHRFKSRSDSEVVLHLYEEHGVDFVDHLRGMFALALWDAPRRRLVLARDRFGKKPLFYHAGPRGLVFASELGALVASRQFEKRPDLDAIDAFITLQYVPAPRTAFEGVRKLPAGHRLISEGGVVHEPEPYYTLRFDQPRKGGDVEELTRELRDVVEESVRIRMVSDVPLGAFLSGGIDSSLIVALMARHSSQPVKTFSVGFTSKDRSELPYAKMVADRYGTDHHEMVVEPDMTSVVPDMVRHYGEPFADTSALPTWYLCQYTRTGVTVALSGDGGDEAFAGYRRYKHCRTARNIRRLPWPLPQLLAGMLTHVPTLRKLRRCATTASASCNPSPYASSGSPRLSRTRTAWRSTARPCGSALHATRSPRSSSGSSGSHALRMSSTDSSTSTSRPI